MPTRTPNEPLIREVLTFIELHPERWDQRSYVVPGECGTIGCFAGWAAILSRTSDLLMVDQPTFVGDVLSQSWLSLEDVLGLTYPQLQQIFNFVAVEPPGSRRQRPPTFQELCDRVEQVTGVRYKNGEQVPA